MSAKTFIVREDVIVAVVSVRLLGSVKVTNPVSFVETFRIVKDINVVRSLGAKTGA